MAKSETKSENLFILIEPSRKELLRAAAKASGVSMGHIVREASAKRAREMLTGGDDD